MDPDILIEEDADGELDPVSCCAVISIVSAVLLLRLGLYVKEEHPALGWAIMILGPAVSISMLVCCCVREHREERRRRALLHRRPRSNEGVEQGDSASSYATFFSLNSAAGTDTGVVRLVRLERGGE